ncbi:hypothetical protein FS837_012768 [Tulasnella sp. UAMH 9824]|nr:hypothetical protein FS837_012768 [Tulasnella sp. UAMH 9824]
MSEEMEEEGSQVMDLLLNGNSTLTPGYAVYKKGQPIKLALFNYITDPSGANDARFNFPSSQPSVRVKYFSTATGSTADKFNLTWAGQTMGDQFGSDGRWTRRRANPKPSNATPVTARSPSKLLNFHSSSSTTQDSIDPIESTETWPTSVATKFGGTAVVDPSVLATSNGRGGAQEAFNIGGTSSGSQVYASAAQRSVFVSGALAGVVAMVVGAWAVLGR